MGINYANGVGKLHFNTQFASKMKCKQLLKAISECKIQFFQSGFLTHSKLINAKLILTLLREFKRITGSFVTRFPINYTIVS